MILRIIGFLTGNFKTIAIVTGLIALLTTGGFLYKAIYDAGKLDVEVKHLRQQLANRQDVIRLQQEAIRITTDLVNARNEELERIEREFQEFAMDQLGPGVNDPAADSLKELFRRLKENRR